MSLTRNSQFRSLLFVPGSKPERFDKALQSGADAVIIDLEDAVSPDDKDEARRAITAWVRPDRRVLVRVNAKGTQWFEQDALLCKLPGVAGVVLPKAENPRDVTELVAIAKTKTAVFPLIESAQGMWNVLEIAKAPFVRQLMFGTLDFMVDMNMELENDDLNQYRAQMAAASRVANIRAPLDGVTTCIDENAIIERDTLNGKRWGFAGKLCIHPKQVAIVNECYAPSAVDVAWAKRVLDASSRADGAALCVDGKMVDRPVVLRAQRIVDLASSALAAQMD
jgi:citrate lyase subunit beta/citryl-CoA lyase